MSGEDYFETLKKKYKSYPVAFALFFSGANNVKALRVECQDIGRELCDNCYIGYDPKGLLYYTDIESFTQHGAPLQPSNPLTYVIKSMINPSDQKRLAHITFTRAGADKPHAEFLAEDPFNAVGNAGMDGYTHTAQWTPLNLGSANATVAKEGDAKPIKITASSIGLTATIPNTENAFDTGEYIGVNGILYFKKTGDIPTGVIADYNNDRIVFYKGLHSFDFAAFFIPYEFGYSTLVPTGNATPKVPFQNVKWAAT